MDADAWDERYAATDLVWSREPNQFVAAELADLPLVWRYVREVGRRHDDVRPMVELLERVVGDTDITRPRGE